MYCTISLHIFPFLFACFSIILFVRGISWFLRLALLFINLTHFIILFVVVVAKFWKFFTSLILRSLVFSSSFYNIFSFFFNLLVGFLSYFFPSWLVSFPLFSVFCSTFNASCYLSHILSHYNLPFLHFYQVHYVLIFLKSFSVIPQALWCYLFVITSFISCVLNGLHKALPSPFLIIAGFKQVHFRFQHPVSNPNSSSHSYYQHCSHLVPLCYLLPQFPCVSFFNITVISCRFPWHSCPFWKLLIPSSFHRVHISFYLLFSPPYHLKQFFFPHQCKFMIDIWLGLFIQLSIYTCCHGTSLRYSIDDTTFWLSLNVMKFFRKSL